MKNYLPLILTACFFLFLLLFPTQTLEASRYGLLLWFDTLLPTLLPFLIVSQLILKTSLIDFVNKFFGPIFSRIFHCSKAGAFCILCGFLCGYPVGARLIALQIKEDQMDLAEGQYLLSFCSNVSPSFCISYGILHSIGTNHILPYLCIIYGSALIFGRLTRPKQSNISKISIKKQTSSNENIFQLIDVCIIDSFLIMIRLCGYLILFSIFTKALSIFAFPENPIGLAFLSAALEITCGLDRISLLAPGMLRTAGAVAALAFGGLCCILQTGSVLKSTGLSLKTYLFHKILIMFLALFLFFCWNFLCCFTINGWS